MSRLLLVLIWSRSLKAIQAMLYATEGISDRADLEKPMVGVASIWYEGNPCNGHLLALGQRVKKSIMGAGITGYQFGAVGVSDGISMGTAGSESLSANGTGGS